MKCPFCEQSETRVLDSRASKDGLSIRRRRKCESCEKRFTTFEHVEFQMPLVIKRDGRREDYKQEKVREGLQKACQKRPVAAARLDQVVFELEKSLMEKSEKEVSSEFIGKLMMLALHELDPVAYIRFASVYREFKDVEEFVQDIKKEEDQFQLH